MVASKKRKTKRPKTSSIHRAIKRLKTDRKNYLSRRPHRSFRRTRRRDYSRSLELPGYVAFTKEVFATLFSQWRIFIPFVLLYTLATIIFVGLSSQDIFLQLSEIIRGEGNESLNSSIGEVGKSALLLLSNFNATYGSSFSESQTLFAGLILALVWLTTVWLLRNVLNGNKIRLRDALYSSGAPLVSTLLIMFIFVVQLVPFLIGWVTYTSLMSAGLLTNGVISMLVFIVAALLGVVSMYLVTSSIFALVIVTLPGTYPLTALRSSGDLVLGRRIRILLRIIWMLLVAAAGVLVLVLPVVFISLKIQSGEGFISTIPLVPFTMSVALSLAVIFICSYIYLLYRKVIEDDAPSA